MPFFVRVIEQPDGWWFRRGRDEVKWFAELDEAVEYATDIGSNDRPSEVLVHHLDGRVDVVATFK